jgi:hypothetical protein
MDVIHADIIDVWNLRDREQVGRYLYPVLIAKEDQHLSSETFKAGIYHLIEDLTRASTSVPTG